MIRRIATSALACMLLAGCGGGGGSSISALPKSPAQSGPGYASFTFKLPGKTTLAKLRRPNYVSQATLGVAIDWTSTNPYSPDYAAAISATCPGTLPAGVTACSIDAQGDTDYAFQLQIPVGTYTFTVSTFDQAPVGSTFAVNVNMLAQGQLAAPVTIIAGQANTITGLTFYGVPKSASLIAAPSQSHVTLYGTGFGVVGNGPQTFYAQALDADGFAIASSDSGAPTLSISESPGDVPTYFATAAMAGSKYGFTLQALAASSNLTLNANIVVTATPPVSTGLTSVSSTFSVIAIPELWAASYKGSTGSINGFALITPSGSGYFAPSQAIDQTTISTFAPGLLAVDGHGNLWAASSGGTTIAEYQPASGSQPMTAGATISGLQSVVALAVDANGNLWVADQNAPDGNGEIIAYNTAGATPSQIALDTLTGTSNPSIANPQALAIVPTQGSTITSTIRGMVVAVSSSGSTGAANFITPSNGTTTAALTFPNVTINAGSSISSASIATNGTFWYYDLKSSAFTAYSFSGTPPTFSAIAGQSLTPAGNQSAVDPTGAAWIGYGSSASLYFVSGSSVFEGQSVNVAGGTLPGGVAISP